MKGSAEPVVFEQALIRSKDTIQLFDGKLIQSTVVQYSEEIDVSAFRKFLLYLGIKSTSTPTTLLIEVEFLDRWTSTWHTLKQGLFASLFYEDGDTATQRNEAFEGECVGRAMRLKLTGVGTTSAAYFTLSASVDLRN